jgi:hypothetical protein
MLESVLAAASTVATSLAGRAFHTVLVRRASASIDEDARGLEAVFFNVELEPPPVGSETWPREDIDELRRSIEADIASEGVSLPTYVRALPFEDPDEPQDEEEVE